ncbi:hypothetical protein NEOKW01_0232 [Nematocida sp. AWRm80]|nr:hypothetical protein NEOKW01_0232 [Nematocida sp. AWRm80]
MYSTDTGNFKVISEIQTVVEKVAQKREDILIITPLEQDKNKLQNEFTDILVKKALETESDILNGNLNPSTVIIDKYSILKETNLFTRVEKVLLEKGIQIIVLIDSELEGEDDLLKEYKLVIEEKRKYLLEIKAESILERLAVVFSVTKLKPIKNICIVLPDKKEQRRIQVFLDAFGIPHKINPSKYNPNEVGLFVNEIPIRQSYSLIIDMTNTIEPETTSVLRVSRAPKKESEKFRLLLDKALEYKYRIESIISMTTAKVLKGMEDIDPALTRYLKRPLLVREKKSIQ